jgi:hypothetical protein
VRLAIRVTACAGLVLLLSAWPGQARPQDTTVLAPEASEAKAREVIQRSIQALGGLAYLGVKDMTRTGRYTTFEHNGESRGTIKITDMLKLPDKERIEYHFKIYYGVDAPIPLLVADIPYPLGKSKSTFEVRNGDAGWIVGTGGVIPLEADALARMRLQRKKDINLLFRTRLNEPGLVLRYGGRDVVDLKLVDWVEVSDADRFTTRIAIEQSTHLPVRAIFLFRDPETNDRVEDHDYFSNYRSIEGIMTPLQIAHEHNGYQASQMFFEEVKYNTGLNDSMFTREALEHLSSKGGKNK